jgi:hypothetical protein
MSSVNLEGGKTCQTSHSSSSRVHSLLVSVDVNHRNHLHEGDDDESECASERVKHLQPILARARREDESNDEAEQADAAGEQRLADSLEDVDVKDGAEHSLEDADLRAESERQEHREEQNRPERRSWQLDNCLGEHDEGESSAFADVREHLAEVAVL